MRKIYYLLCMLAVVLLAGCSREEKDLFDDSSANRADAAIASNMDILTSASNGWLMEYFPAMQQEYGGYNILLKFNADGSVKASSEVYQSGDAVSSYFSIKQSAGIVLSFDTYNEIFHFFSDPSDPAGAGGNGFGMEGDYDFLVVEASPEKVVLKGKKSAGFVVLSPIQEDWTEYIDKIQEADEMMASSKYELAIAGNTIPVSTSYRTLTFNYEENGDKVSKIASYIVTPTGFKFYQPVEIFGKTISGFVYDAAGSIFKGVEDAAVTMIPVIPPLNEQFVVGDWFIAYSKAGAFAQPYFDIVNTTLTQMGEELVFAFIGSALYGQFGFNFNSSGYGGLLGLDYEFIGEDKISLKFNMTGKGDGVWYHNNANFHYLLNPFGYSGARTFTLTADNPAGPKFMTLTEDANPNNVITLSASQINYPFKN